jgi:phosphate transport system protein
MERHFEQELEKLGRRLMEMGTLVEQQMNMTLNALINTDIDMAAEVIEMDNKVDHLDVKIDKLCQRIFALQQPMAKDLRFIMSALKINNDLERMGDLAVFIAKRVDCFVDYKEVLIELQIDTVASNCIKLIKDTENLIQTKRTVFVKDIFDGALGLKTMTREISSNIIEGMTQKSTDILVVATNLVLILNQIERVSALATNIAESVYFMVEGTIVKHSKDFLAD